MRSRARLVVNHLSRSVAVFALLAAVGCGGGIGDVSGTVKYKGKPLDGGQIQFQAGNGKIFAADIDKDGKYTVTGVPSGSAKIAVSYIDPKVTEYWKAMSAGGRGNPEGGKAPSLPKGDPDQFNKIPANYADFAGSGLTFDVKKGSNTHDVELK
jgi:hypothetical protein